MPNTLRAELVSLSNRMYKEWYNKTVLVQSCDNTWEGEFDLDKREVDIPIYHDLTVHQTTLKEHELKPATVEFVRASTKRVSIDKMRYSHWGETKISTLINKLSANDSIVREKMMNKWAQEAEKELGIWCARLPKKQTIDLTDLLGGDGVLDATNVVHALDILKAHAISNKYTPEDFKLYVSEKFETVLRDSKILTGANLDANEAFRKGFVGYANGVDVRKIEIPEITTRNSNTKLVDAEWGIWKTRDGIQYVVPYKDTINYDISPEQVLLGGKGYQSVEFYDFFNLYPGRLQKVKIRYTENANPPVL